MILLVLTFLFLIAAAIGPRFIPDRHDRRNDEPISMAWVRWMARGVCISIAALFFASTSIIYIDSDEVGHMKRIYGGDNMPASQVLAAPWQKGAQARILTPGFKFISFVKVFYDIETFPLVTVPEGRYGFLVAKDGAPLRPNQYLADAWEQKNFQKMIDAEYFLGFDKGEDEYKGSRGQKGPQLSVLRPGQYRINQYLFEIKEGKSTDIEAGFVGVVKSNVGDEYTGPALLPTGVKTTDLSVPIVPKGNQGVWADVLKPGRYYMNQRAYKITKIDTRVQTWKYLGGYTRRFIDLEVGDDGKIIQAARDEEFETPEGAADRAIVLRIQGWEVFLDSRVQVQVTPENAPFVVASVGDLVAIENKIITPNYRSIVRNVTAQDITVTEPKLDLSGDPIREPLMKDGEVVLDDNNKPVPDPKGKIIMQTVTRQRKVLDLLYHREGLETEVAAKLVPAGAQAGLTVQWVRFGDPAVPPELLLPGKRKQLARQLASTYVEERIAQVERVNTERERARADQQPTLMKSEIGITVADNNKLARTKQGEGEKAYLSLVAEGQEKQANVLGKGKAFELAYIEKVLEAAKTNPNIIKVPRILVMGSGSGLEGAAAILGANNLTLGLSKSKVVNQAQ